jgi:hypothetical protein
MKSVFSVCKIFSFCFFIVYVCSSCTSYLIVNGGQHVPKKVTIYVTGFDLTTGHLILKDISHNSADPFIAYPGQIIRWKISGITHFLIDNLVEKKVKARPDEVFKKEPHPVKFFSESWKGTLKDSTGLHGIAFVSDSGGHFINYNYKIVWHKAGQHHTFDPRIQIKLP